MKLNRILLMVFFALLSLPQRALAHDDTDTFTCGTPYPFWWRYDGPRSDIVVRGWEIRPAGADFQIVLSLVNVGEVTVAGGMAYQVAHAAVDARLYRDPTSLGAPDARALLGTEALGQGTLPALRPGESTVVTLSARGLRTDANHILTIAFYDGGLSSIDPAPPARNWLRILSPRLAPRSLQLVGSAIRTASSSLPGYSGSFVSVTVKNVGRIALEPGTSVSLIHGNNGSAGGYWGPDDTIDPNNPGNPYAIIFRESLFQGVLTRALLPGETITVDGMANIPQGSTTLQGLTLAVGN